MATSTYVKTSAHLYCGVNSEGGALTVRDINGEWVVPSMEQFLALEKALDNNLLPPPNPTVDTLLDVENSVLYARKETMSQEVWDKFVLSF